MPFQTKQILLVDDSDDIRQMLGRTLELAHYTVHLADNGLSALKVLQKITPDIIISDVNMPEMNGIEFCKAVRQNTAWLAIPFIFLTGNTANENIHMGRQLGVEDYLTKPIDPKELLAIVNARLLRAAQVQVAQMDLAYFETVNVLANTIEGRDPYTYGHVERVATYARLNFIAYLLKLAGSAALLWLGVGLLSVPLAGLAAVLVQRTLARRACLACLGAPPPTPTDPALCRVLIGRLWPNASRIGFLGVGSYLGGQAMAFLCLTTLGLAANAQYGLSLQIMSVAQGMAVVWIQVKWPAIARLRTQGDFAGIRAILRQRLWLSVATFGLLVAVAIPLAPPLLRWLNTDKAVMPAAWLCVMAVHTLLEMHLSVWGMLIYTDNRVPYLRPLLLANGASLGLAIGLLHFTGLGLGALVLAPLLAGGAFNYWHWPRVGGGLLQTSCSRLLFARRAD